MCNTVSACLVERRDGLVPDLQRVREQGYAVDDEEQLVGIRAVGVLVTTSDGDVLAPSRSSGQRAG